MSNQPKAEVFLSTDGKHTVVVRDDDADKAYDEAKAVYERIAKDLGTKVQMWGDAMSKKDAPKAAQRPQKRASTTVTADADAPYCPTHGRQMKRFTGAYGPFYKCTAKLPDGNWCNEKQSIK